MKKIEKKEFTEEISDDNKPIAYESRGYPYNSLNDRQFEDLIYHIFQEEIKAGKYKEKFDRVHLTQSVGERGRDIFLTYKGNNCGVIQCKKHSSRLSKPDVAREIIKFILYYLKDNSLISDINNFTYFLIVSSNFSGPAIELLSNFNQRIIQEEKLPKWTEQVIKKFKSFKDLKFKSVREDLQKILATIKVEYKISEDLNYLLHQHPDIISYYFQTKKILVSNLELDFNNTLEEKIDKKISSAIKQSDRYYSKGESNIEMSKLFDIDEIEQPTQDNLKYLQKYIIKYSKYPKYIKCLDQDIPLINNYNLFNFTDIFQKSITFRKIIDNIETIEERIIILRGESGIGKTQLLKYLNYLFSKKILEDHSDIIPILIDLNHWSLKKSLYQCVEDIFLNETTINKKILKPLLKEQKLLLLLDAFNELNTDDRIQFLKDLSYFISQYSKVRFIISMKLNTEFLNYRDVRTLEIYMKSLNLENLGQYYSQLHLNLNFDDFLEQIDKKNLSSIIKIPLFLNYLFIYLKIKDTFPNSKYDIIDTIIQHYFEDYIKSKFDYIRKKDIKLIWQEILQKLSFYMHCDLESNKIETKNLRKFIHGLIERKKKDYTIPEYINSSDLIEFFYQHNILVEKNTIIKFWHEILFDYYCGMEMAGLINKGFDIKSSIPNFFHKANLKEALIIAFPLIKNENFINKLRTENIFIYIKGLLEKDKLTDDEIHFAQNYLYKIMNSSYFYLRELAFRLYKGLVKFVDKKEETLLKFLNEFKDQKYTTQTLLELGKLKSSMAKKSLLDYNDSWVANVYRLIALCSFDDTEIQDLIINVLKEKWFGGYYINLITEGLLKVQKRNALSEKSFKEILKLFLNPPEKLVFSSDPTKEFSNSYSITSFYRKALMPILIEKKDVKIIPKLLNVLNYNGLNYFNVCIVISEILDRYYFNKILSKIYEENDYKDKIPLILIIKNSNYPIDFKEFIKFLKKIPKNVQTKEKNIFYGDLIELLLHKERFIDYNAQEILEFLPQLVTLGGSIQQSIIEVITNDHPKYFFENQLEFKIHIWAFKVLLNIIGNNKFVELKDFLIKHAKLCIPNWMYDSKRAFHNKFLFSDILVTLLDIECYKEGFQLLDNFIDKIEDWKNINPLIFKPINQFKNSERIFFIRKVYNEYANLEKEGNSNPYIFISDTITPYNSKKYIQFCLEILRESIKKNYVLAEAIMRNLLFLKPKSIDDKIMKLFDSEIHKEALPMVLRLIAMCKSKTILQFLNDYLYDEDSRIKNTAFNELHRIYEDMNILWYNNMEKN